MQKFSLEPIYSRLGDEESRFLFEKRLCYSLTGDMQKMVRAMNNENAVYKKLKEAEKEIFVFGSGITGHAVVSSFPEIPWRVFIDNDKSKVGKPDILPIISFEEFIKNSSNTVVFITSHLYGFEMRQQLISSDFPENCIVSHLNQYFDLPYLKSQKNEFFIDAGGYDGNSTKAFFRWLKGESRSIIFEPNFIQCKICEGNFQNCDNVQTVNKGLWHKKEILKFHKDRRGSKIDSEGEEIIETISLDEYLKEEKEPVTFIKMDIEGAELNALKGAERIIRGQKPKLAICIYHKPEDIWEIPSLLLDFVPNYKFYIRHYSFNNNDTVLYALPS